MVDVFDDLGAGLAGTADGGEVFAAGFKSDVEHLPASGPVDSPGKFADAAHADVDFALVAAGFAGVFDGGEFVELGFGGGESSAVLAFDVERQPVVRDLAVGDGFEDVLDLHHLFQCGGDGVGVVASGVHLAGAVDFGGDADFFEGAEERVEKVVRVAFMLAAGTGNLADGFTDVLFVRLREVRVDTSEWVVIIADVDEFGVCAFGFEAAVDGVGGEDLPHVADVDRPGGCDAGG